MIEMLGSPLMQRALLAALLVGAIAPVIGVYLVQRRLALLGDGIGHIALTGVAAGWLAGTIAGASTPESFALPGAMTVAVIGAVGIEWVKARGRVPGDVAMAIMFYGGIAGGVLLIKVAGGTSANLMAYLFGSIATVSRSDLISTAALAAPVLAIGVGLRGALFSISYDEEFARASGLPVQFLASLLAALAAVTVTVSMRVVGLLLVSALMIIPVAIAQTLSRSFTSTMVLASGVGALVSVTGLSFTYWYDLPPGATIVVLAVALYAIASTIERLRGVPPMVEDPHPNLDDDVDLPHEH